MSFFWLFVIQIFSLDIHSNMVDAQEIKAFVKKGQTGKALELLEEFAKGTDWENQVIGLCGRFAKIKEKDLGQVEGRVVIQTELNKVHNDVLRILDELLSQQKKISQNGHQPKKKVNSELVVRSENDITRIELLIEGNFEDFSHEKREKVLKDLAYHLGINMNDLRGLPPRSGSIIFPVELPSDKVELLERLIKEGKIEGAVGVEKVYTRKGKEVDVNGRELSYANFENTNLKWANLYGVNLYKANLYGANLIEAILRKAELGKTDLRVADLSGAYLQGGTNLEEANLEGANLRKANIEEANLKKANLRGANLRKTNLRRADLREANLQEVQIEEETNLEQANLEKANLKWASLENVNLERINLEGANLEGASLEGANLEG
ncbi:MAG: pentapeptide repeat-containing protein, partial [Simkania sp.]|nr:pentapeptide repeat-containing protein [Simkania sp.]